MFYVRIGTSVGKKNIHATPPQNRFPTSTLENCSKSTLISKWRHFITGVETTSIWRGMSNLEDQTVKKNTN